MAPVSEHIDIYTNRAHDCPMLIMRLLDKDSRPFILLAHIRADSVDSEVINLISILEIKNMIPTEIIFAPRADSVYDLAATVLKSFLQRNINIIVRDADETSTARARALVTDKGYVIMSDFNDNIISSGLWQQNISKASSEGSASLLKDRVVDMNIIASAA